MRLQKYCYFFKGKVICQIICQIICQAISKVFFKSTYKSKAFTLLEVMIAMTLFSVMALFLMRITDSGVRYQKIITKNVKNIRSIRSVWQVLRQDFYNVFLVKNKHVLLHSELMRLAPDRKNNNLSRRGVPSPEGLDDYGRSRNVPKESSPRPPTKPPLVGQFKGTDEQVYFTTLSHGHTSVLSPQSDSTLVFYYLKACPHKDTNKAQRCLWRKSFLDITADPEKAENGTEFLLLENVNKIKLAYFNILDNEWKNQWPMGVQSSNLLPVAVKIVLVFQNKKKQIVTKQLILPIHRNYIALRMLR